MTESLDLSLYTLHPATPEQVLESRKRTHVQWGRGAPVEEYLKRDERLDVHDHANNGRLTTWVLVPRDDPSTLNFLCSCETYRREAFILLPGTDEAQEVTAFGVASVFTPVHNRRKGAANRMMSLLHHVLAPEDTLPALPTSWGAPPPGPFPPNHTRGPASVLYSDIGSEFYRRCGPNGDATEGWVVSDPRGTVWDVASSLAAIGDTPEGLTRLALDDCNRLWNQDSELMRTYLGELAEDRGSNETLVSYAPWRGVGGFQSWRAAFYLESRGEATLNNWGAVLSDTHNDPSPIYATWTIDIEDELTTLIVTRIRCPPSRAGEFYKLLYAALKVAEERGMSKVEVWNCPPHLLSAPSVPTGVTADRSNHLSAIAWYGQGKARWINNEKFVWC